MPVNETKLIWIARSVNVNNCDKREGSINFCATLLRAVLRLFKQSEIFWPLPLKNLMWSKIKCNPFHLVTINNVSDDLCVVLKKTEEVSNVKWWCSKCQFCPCIEDIDDELSVTTVLFVSLGQKLFNIWSLTPQYLILCCGAR